MAKCISVKEISKQLLCLFTRNVARQVILSQQQHLDPQLVTLLNKFCCINPSSMVVNYCKAFLHMCILHIY